MVLAAARGLPDFNAGDQAYLVITLATPSIFTRFYRPRPYYILETRVMEVRGEGAEGKRYGFDTEFYTRPGHVFACLDEAKRRLQEVFAIETGGVLPAENIRLVSSEEQKAGEKAVHAAPIATPPAYAAS
jgi:hypothetical protein